MGTQTSTDKAINSNKCTLLKRGNKLISYAFFIILIKNNKNKREPKASRKKEIIMVNIEVSEIENRKTIGKILKQRAGF